MEDLFRPDCDSTAHRLLLLIRKHFGHVAGSWRRFSRSACLWAKKISPQHKRSGPMERMPHRRYGEDSQWHRKWLRRCEDCRLNQIGAVASRLLVAKHQDKSGSCPLLNDVCLGALTTKPKKLAAQRLHRKCAIILRGQIVRIRFQFEQLERSLPEIEQFFRTLWISAPRGRVMLAPYHAGPVGPRIADVKFLLNTHRCHRSCSVYVNLGSARASLRREARRGSRSDIFKLTLFWVGTF